MARRMIQLISAGLVAAFPLYALTISGTVTNSSTNAAVPNATVTFQTFGGGGGNTYIDTTNAQGQYSIANVPTTATIGRLTPAATGYQVAPGAFITLAGRDTVINLTLTPTGTTTGTGTIKGAVTDSGSGNAIDSAKVVLLQISGGGVLTRVDSVLTAANGSFTFDSLPAGRYDISVSKRGYATDNSNTNIAVANGQTVTVNVALLSAAANSGTVIGTVTDSAAGSAIAGAKVVLNQTIGGGRQAAIDSTTTDALGKYSLTLVTPGRNYSIAASATGFLAATSRAFTVTAGVTDTVNLALVARIPANSVIKGTVTDSASGNAISGASVVLSMRSGTAVQPVDTLTTGATGSFAFAGLDVGTYLLTVSMTDFRSYTTPTTRPIQITTTHDTVTVAVALVPVAKGSLAVFVDSSGSALPGVSIAVTTRVPAGQTGQTFTGTTAQNGWVSFANIPTASYDITASKAGLNTLTQNTTVGANATDTVRLSLTRASGAKTVKGVVKSSSGANLSGAQVILTATRAGSSTILTLTATTAANGSYTITGIPVAYTTATLAISLTGYTTKDTTISIANDTTTVNVTLQAPTSVLTAAAAAPSLSLSATMHGVSLRIADGLGAARVVVYALDGKVLLDRVVSHGAANLALPRGLHGTPAIVQVKQGGLVIRREVMLP